MARLAGRHHTACLGRAGGLRSAPSSEPGHSSGNWSQQKAELCSGSRTRARPALRGYITSVWPPAASSALCNTCELQCLQSVLFD